jgi:putative ATP-dependent DNA ligase
LETGIPKNIRADVFYAEEKIDGYNLRAAKIEGKLFAFTRGGYADPFATEKIRAMPQLRKFFDEYPDYVLCGEMIGNTPFTEPTDKFDVKFLVFDIDNGNSYLPPLEKYHLLKKFDIEAVPFLGRFNKTQLPLVKKTAEYLNKGRKEGMVLKSADRSDVIKFVTPHADIEDIASSAYMLFDMPAGFFHQRVLRSAFFLDDFCFCREEYGKQLGCAFYSGMLKAINDIKAGKELTEEFEILVSDVKIFDKVKAHMGKEVAVRIIFKKSEKGQVRIRFAKVYKESTRQLGEFFRGKGIID